MLHLIDQTLLYILLAMYVMNKIDLFHDFVK